mmetsp:Transcript_1364/g.2208  ORF Transcript_1364/g.2208 Transcript_1364/m.2208 type:complete len:253 (-) Transcript_1364:107-865(-)
MLKLVCVFVSICVLSCTAFRGVSRTNLHIAAIGRTSRQQDSSTTLHAIDAPSLLTSLLQRTEPEQARNEFFFFFFAGSGALGIGVAQFPKLLANYNRVQELAGGPSAGGVEVSANPVAGIALPESLKVADVEYIIKNFPQLEEIAEKGEKTSYMAQIGYLEREGFEACYDASTVNPVALNAAWEAIGEGGGDLVAPQMVAATALKWQAEGVDAFVQDLTKANIRKYSAFTVFFGLIALVLDLIIESAQSAFF